MGKESRIQQMCVSWFRLQFPELSSLLFSVPNGGTRIFREAVVLKKEGLVAGVSDLILLMPCSGYASLCIEMKTDDKTSRQSQSQKEWQKAVEAVGNKYVVCRNFDEFKIAVRTYLLPYIQERFKKQHGNS